MIKLICEKYNKRGNMNWVVYTPLVNHYSCGVKDSQFEFSSFSKNIQLNI